MWDNRSLLTAHRRGRRLRRYRETLLSWRLLVVLGRQRRHAIGWYDDVRRKLRLNYPRRPRWPCLWLRLWRRMLLLLLLRLWWLLGRLPLRHLRLRLRSLPVRLLGHLLVLPRRCMRRQWRVLTRVHLLLRKLRLLRDVEAGVWPLLGRRSCRDSRWVHAHRDGETIFATVLTDLEGLSGRRHERLLVSGSWSTKRSRRHRLLHVAHAVRRSGGRTKRKLTVRRRDPRYAWHHTAHWTVLKAHESRLWCDTRAILCPIRRHGVVSRQAVRHIGRRVRMAGMRRSTHRRLLLLWHRHRIVEGTLHTSLMLLWQIRWLWHTMHGLRLRPWRENRALRARAPVQHEVWRQSTRSLELGMTLPLWLRLLLEMLLLPNLLHALMLQVHVGDPSHASHRQSSHRLLSRMQTCHCSLAHH